MNPLAGAVLAAVLIVGALPASGGYWLPSGRAGKPHSAVILAAYSDPGSDSLRLPRSSERYPLHRAAIEDDAAAVVALIGRGVAADARDEEGRTPLMVAAAFGNAAVAARLIALGADPLSRDGHGEAAIHFAARAGKTALVAMLLDEDVDPDFPALPRGVTALHYAATFGHERVVRQLVSAGAAIDAADIDGIRPLQYASRRNRYDLVEVFVALGARPQTFHDAVNADDIGQVLDLIRLGADLDAPDLFGPPINLAAAKGYLAMTRVLADAGADLEATGDPSRSRPLHLAAMYGHAAVAAFLIDRGAAVDARDGWGRTALMVAATFGGVETARLLLDRAADPKAGDGVYGDTAIHFAAMAGRKDIVALLLSRGIPVDLPSGHDGESPLHYAAWSRNLPLVQYLVANGADVSRRDDNGATPLRYALEKGEADGPIAEFLRRVGATE